MAVKPLLNQLEKPELEQGFLQKILKPYRKNCTYLNTGYMRYDRRKKNDQLTLHGEFSIDDSCYIDDTGHFNAVEANICYNQMAYAYFGYGIKHGIIPELKDYTLDTFYKKQLSNFLILDINASFKRQIDSKSFVGVFGVKEYIKKSSFVLAKTYCSFNDEQDGQSYSEVVLAILNL